MRLGAGRPDPSGRPPRVLLSSASRSRCSPHEQTELVDFEDTRQTPEARAAFDRAVAQVNDGTAQVRKLSGESIRGFVVDGQKILGQAVLEYVLEGLSSASRDVSPAGTPVPVWSARRAVRRRVRPGVRRADAPAAGLA